MPNDVTLLAEVAYRRMIGQRVTLALPEGTITGKVLPGIFRFESQRRFRLRARETHYLSIEYALRLRAAAPIKKRRAA